MHLCGVIYLSTVQDSWYFNIISRKNLLSLHAKISDKANETTKNHKINH